MLHSRATLVLAFLTTHAFGQPLKLKTSEGVTVQIDPWGNNAVRVRIGAKITNVPTTQAMLDAAPAVTGHGPAVVEESRVTHGNLEASVSEETGKLAFTRVSDGTVLLTEHARTISAGTEAAGAAISFNANGASEILYGMGEHRHTGTPANGTGSVRIPKPWNQWMQDSQNYGKSFGGDNTIPILHSTVGYSFLWNSPAFGGIELTDDLHSWNSTLTTMLDFWVSTTPASIANDESKLAPLLTGYVDVTGHAPKLPFWASGFWQCKNRYRNQTQVLDVARGYVKRGLPISVIVIDYFHWQHLGDWKLNKGPSGKVDDVCWPDPQAMVDELKEYGIEVMVSMWPLVGGPTPATAACSNAPTAGNPGQPQKCSDNWHDLKDHQYLMGNGGAGAAYEPQPEEGGTSYLYDSFNPKARDFVWGQMQHGYHQFGIKTFWLDADEPESFMPVAAPGKRFFNDSGDGWRVDNEVGMAWVQKHHRMVHDGLIKNGEKSGDFVFLSRGAWAGSQRYGAAVWSGDIESRFEELQVQIKVAQNTAMSGIDKWTTDIGGYKNGDPTSPYFRELVVRWFQFGAFCPLFRLHGDREGPKPAANECGVTDGSNEIWNFGEEAMKIIPGVMRLRENLRNYVDSYMNFSATTGMSIVRPMVLQFPADAKCAGVDVEDQYMFGDDWLVAPIYEQGATSRSVYLPVLPAGQVWENYYSNVQTTGGQRITEKTTLADFPLYRRAVHGAKTDN